MARTPGPPGPRSIGAGAHHSRVGTVSTATPNGGAGQIGRDGRQWGGIDAATGAIRRAGLIMKDAARCADGCADRHGPAPGSQAAEPRPSGREALRPGAVREGDRREWPLPREFHGIHARWRQALRPQRIPGLVEAGPLSRFPQLPPRVARPLSIRPGHHYRERGVHETLGDGRVVDRGARSRCDRTEALGFGPPARALPRTGTADGTPGNNGILLIRRGEIRDSQSRGGGERGAFQCAVPRHRAIRAKHPDAGCPRKQTLGAGTAASRPSLFSASRHGPRILNRERYIPRLPSSSGGCRGIRQPHCTRHGVGRRAPGSERIRGAYAWRSLLDTGVVIPRVRLPVEEPEAPSTASTRRSTGRALRAAGGARVAERAAHDAPPRPVRRSRRGKRVRVAPGTRARGGSAHPVGKLADLVVCFPDGRVFNLPRKTRIGRRISPVSPLVGGGRDVYRSRRRRRTG